MRILIDTLVALMLVGILAGVMMHNRQTKDDRENREIARLEVRRFQQQIHLQNALAGVSTERDGPVVLDPLWFQGNLPANPLLGADHPWVEVAGPSQQHLQHPYDPATSNPDVASFWYNPYLSLVRARVPVGISDQQTLELYNYVNETQLTTLISDPAVASAR
jgi:hypothetical protein